MCESNELIIIQARVGSSRLPGKMTRPFFNGNTILEILIKEFKFSLEKTPLIIATSDNPRDDQIKAIAEKNGVNYFRGSEEDVLARFIQATENRSETYVARICGDNPFVRGSDVAKLFSKCKPTMHRMERNTSLVSRHRMDATFVAFFVFGSASQRRTSSPN